MPAAYLEWLTDVFDDAQVPFNAESMVWLDASLRRMVDGEKATEEEVYRRIRQRWLNHGLPGRQLLATMLRDEIFSRRDSPMRPVEGGAYYTNDYRTTAVLPTPHRGS